METLIPIALKPKAGTAAAAAAGGEGCSFEDAEWDDIEPVRPKKSKPKTSKLVEPKDYAAIETHNVRTPTISTIF